MVVDSSWAKRSCQCGEQTGVLEVWGPQWGVGVGGHKGGSWYVIYSRFNSHLHFENNFSSY